MRIQEGVTPRGCVCQAVEGCVGRERVLCCEAAVGGRDWACAVSPGRGEGRVWEPGPLTTHYSFSPQPTAPQHRPAWLGAGTGTAGLARRKPQPSLGPLSTDLGTLGAASGL